MRQSERKNPKIAQMMQNNHALLHVNFGSVHRPFAAWALLQAVRQQYLMVGPQQRCRRRIFCRASAKLQLRKTLQAKPLQNSLRKPLQEYPRLNTTTDIKRRVQLLGN